MLFGAGGGCCAKASSIFWIRASGRIPFHRTDFGCTHQGEWRGITPTGKAVQVTAVGYFLLPLPGRKVVRKALYGFGSPRGWRL